MGNKTPADDGFTIDDKFKNLLPSLNPVDYAKLEESLLEEGGCRDSLVVWEEEKILVDGHNRYAICKEHGLAYAFEEKSFANRDAVIEWIFNHQKGRRNMTRFQWAEAVLKCKDSIKKRAKANQSSGGGADRLKSDKPVITYKELARLAGMGHSTLRQVEFILKHAGQTTLNRLRNGDAGVSINGVHEELKELVDKRNASRSSTTKSKQRKSKSTSLPSPIPEEPPQDLAGHIIAALDELERRYSKIHDRIDLYNMVGDISNEWAHKKKIELAMSQK